MKLKVINTYKSCLTSGKEYEVVEVREDLHMYKIINNQGKEEWVAGFRFAK